MNNDLRCCNTYCGKPIDPGASVCPNCGTNQLGHQKMKSIPVKPTYLASSGRKAPIALITVMIIVLAIGGVAAAMHFKKANAEPPKPVVAKPEAIRTLTVFKLKNYGQKFNGKTVKVKAIIIDQRQDSFIIADNMDSFWALMREKTGMPGKPGDKPAVYITVRPRDSSMRVKDIVEYTGVFDSVGLSLKVKEAKKVGRAQ